MKKFLVLSAALFLMLSASLPPAVMAVQAGQTCPVSGDTIKSDKFTAEYKGKTYQFCCKGCVRKFNKDPEKFITS